jgi:hypothetical protein
VHHQAADDPGEPQHRDQRRAGDAAEREQGLRPEGERRHLGDAVDELRIDADGQQHRTAGDPGNQVRQAHEQAADRAPDGERLAAVLCLLGSSGHHARVTREAVNFEPSAPKRVLQKRVS